MVGVILFDSAATIEFSVTQHTNLNSLLLAIEKIPYRGGGTNIAAGLNLLHTAGKPGGALNLRDGFTHVAILITDGKSSQSDTSAAAAALHASKIYTEVYAVGVSGADVNQLNLIASEPSLVFFDSNFDSAAISSLEQSLTQQLMPCLGKYISIAHQNNLKISLIINRCCHGNDCRRSTFQGSTII